MEACDSRHLSAKFGEAAARPLASLLSDEPWVSQECADLSLPAVVSLSRSSPGRHGLGADMALGSSAWQLGTLVSSASCSRTSERFIVATLSDPSLLS